MTCADYSLGGLHADQRLPPVDLVGDERNMIQSKIDDEKRTYLPGTGDTLITH